MHNFPSNCDDSIPLPFVKYKYIKNKYLSIFETKYIAPTTYATQSMMYQMNHKFGSDRQIKQNECFFIFKTIWRPVFWEKQFLNQRCAMLNPTQNAMSILVPATFYFFVGQEITLPSSLQHHQGNKILIILLLLDSICDYIQSLIVTCYVSVSFDIHSVHIQASKLWKDRYGLTKS